MLGAILGDISGSRFEFRGIKTKDFPFFSPDCRFTDDTVMTVAVAKALMRASDCRSFKQFLVEDMQELGRTYIKAGYGGNFYRWLLSDNPAPYGSYGNGSAMRVSPCALFASSLDEALELAEISASVTHNHPEGIKGAKAEAAAVFLAKKGKPKDFIRDYITDNFYALDRTADMIRPGYEFDVSCQGSVPESIQCFLECGSYVDTVKTAISLGGDTDTMGAMAGAIAFAYYGCEDEIIKEGRAFLTDDLLLIIDEFDAYIY